MSKRKIICCVVGFVCGLLLVPVTLLIYTLYGGIIVVDNDTAGVMTGATLVCAILLGSAGYTFSK